MRVIAGKARRIQLDTIKGMQTRPTTDRIKETLYNIIQNNIYGANFLDLFSGSGAIGIEALSRGAEHACFVENSSAAIKCIKSNLDKTGLTNQSTVVHNSVDNALKSIENQREKFDIVFMDPPYNQGYEKQVLIFLSKSDLIDKSSLVIVEASLDTDFSYINQINFEIVREKNYKTNKHIFLKKCGE